MADGTVSEISFVNTIRNAWRRVQRKCLLMLESLREFPRNLLMQLREIDTGIHEWK